VSPNSSARQVADSALHIEIEYDVKIAGEAREVPDTALSVQYAMEGNIDGLEELFARKLATPWDVSKS